MRIGIGHIIVAIALLCGCNSTTNSGDPGTTDNGKNPPGKPENFTAVPDRPYEMFVSWSDLNNENGYVVYKGSGAVDSLSANTTTYRIKNLPGLVYNTYHVVAYNNMGRVRRIP